MSIIVRDCRDADLPAILDIHNDAILHTTAIWTYAPADLANRRALLADRRARGFPYLVAEDAGTIVGYASFGAFRPFDGYHRTVEHSVYVHRERRGQGIAGLLMPPLIASAERLGMHVMIGAIEASNAASIRLHEKLGFAETGRLREVGFKFDRYLDLVLMQKMLG
jgi:L-amino acid N-acyltransferase YncA